MIERSVLVACLLVGAACLIGAGFSVRLPLAAKLVNSASLLFGIASIVQLRLSGWFDSVIEFYGDEAKFPSGPPSHITRQIIDNPDAPLLTWLRNTLFFEANTGAYLGLLSLGVALIAVWMPES